MRPRGTFFGGAKARTEAAEMSVEVPSQETRWVWRRKAQVVTAVDSGVLSLDEACRRYEMSIEEFRSWQKTYYYSAAGTKGEKRSTSAKPQGHA
jgi:hypothetical protein